MTTLIKGFEKLFTNLTIIFKLKKASPTLKNKYLKHFFKQFKSQSVKKIERQSNSQEKITFHEFQQDKIKAFFKELPKRKPSTFTNIPVKIMVNLVHVYSHTLMKNFKDFVKSGNFPDLLK